MKSFANRLFVATFTLAAALYGCSGDSHNPGDTTLTNVPAEQAIKAVKHKFYVSHGCAVYENINTFACNNGIIEATCKDMSGAQQSDFYLQDANDATVWYSEMDLDQQIVEIQARLMDANTKKAAFTQAKGPSAQCAPN